jgi:hypothetical protein
LLGGKLREPLPSTSGLILLAMQRHPVPVPCLIGPRGCRLGQPRLPRGTRCQCSHRRRANPWAPLALQCRLHGGGGCPDPGHGPGDLSTAYSLERCARRPHSSPKRPITLEHRKAKGGLDMRKRKVYTCMYEVGGTGESGERAARYGSDVARVNRPWLARPTAHREAGGQHV